MNVIYRPSIMGFLANNAAHINLTTIKQNKMSELTNAQLVANVVAYIVSKTPQSASTTVNDQIVAINEALAKEPPTLPQAIENLGELIKRSSDNEHVHDLIDAAIDLSVYEPGESLSDDIKTALAALSSGVKAWSNERKENRKKKRAFLDGTIESDDDAVKI